MITKITNYREYYNADDNYENIIDTIQAKREQSTSFENFLSLFSKKEYGAMLYYLRTCDVNEFSFTVGMPHSGRKDVIIYDYVRKMLYDALGVGYCDSKLADLLFWIESSDE